MIDNDEYSWEGSWEAPGYGSYTIAKNGRELEPHEVIDELTRVSDLFQQNEALQERIAELEDDNAGFKAAAESAYFDNMTLLDMLDD